MLGVIRRGVMYDIARRGVSVFGRNADDVLRDLSHPSAWGHCATVHYGNKKKQVCATTVDEKIVCAVCCLATPEGDRNANQVVYLRTALSCLGVMLESENFALTGREL